MKKTVLFIVLACCIIAPVFSQQETEIWSSLGVSFGNYFESGEGMEDMYMGSLGVDLNFYFFFNKKNIGFFLNFGFLAPVVNNLDVDYQMFHVNYLIGAGFRHEIKENLNLHFGIGFNVISLDLYREENSNVKIDDFRTILGIGGDIGIKHDFTDIVYLDIGAKLSFNFANNRIIESTADGWENTVTISNDFVKDYTMFEIRPYILVGFNSYSRGENRFGKP